MELIDKLNDIQSFKLWNGLVLQQNNQIIYNNEEIYDEFINKIDFVLFKNRLFLDDKEGNYLILDNNFIIVEKGEDKAFFYINNTTIGIQSLSDKGIVTSLSNNGFNSFFEEVNFDFFGTNTFFTNNKFIYKKTNEEISIFNILAKNVISVPLSQLGIYLDGIIEKPLQVTEFSGIYNNTLVCTLNNGGILLLDIYNGEVVAYFEEARIRHNLFAKAEGSPIFWGLNHQTFVEMDVENAVILRQIDLEQYLHDFFNVKVLKSINVSFAIDGLIYFGADTDIVGIFDPIKAVIIDHHWFEFEKKYTMLKGGKENMQVKGNKIYCLDTNDTLHVLETAVGKGLA